MIFGDGLCHYARPRDDDFATMKLDFRDAAPKVDIA